MYFYVYRNEQNVGPLSEDELVSALQSGRFQSNDLGCRVGETEWKDLGMLFPLLKAKSQVSYQPSPPPIYRPQQQVVVYQPPPANYPAGQTEVGRLMYYQANQKSASTAYLLWFFLGGFSAHRFYMGKTGSAIGQALLWWCSLFLCYVLIGFLIVWIPIVWIFIDLFLISGWVREHNNRLVADIGGFR